MIILCCSQKLTNFLKFKHIIKGIFGIFLFIVEGEEQHISHTYKHTHTHTHTHTQTHTHTHTHTHTNVCRGKIFIKNIKKLIFLQVSLLALKKYVHHVHCLESFLKSAFFLVHLV